MKYLAERNSIAASALYDRVLNHAVIFIWAMFFLMSALNVMICVLLAFDAAIPDCFFCHMFLRV